MAVREPRKKRPERTEERGGSAAANDIDVPGIRLTAELRANDELFRLAFSPTGSHIAATSEKSPCVWDLDRRQLLEEPVHRSGLPIHSVGIFDLAWSADGTRLMVGGVGAAVYALVSQRLILQRRVLASRIVRAIRSLPDHLIAVGFAAGGLMLVDVSSPETSVEITYQQADCLAVGSEAHLLASASSETQGLSLWDIKTRKCIWRAQRGSCAKRVAFDPRSRWLASVGDDCMLSVWDIEHGELLHRAEGHESTIDEIAVSCHGDLVATASSDHTIRLWRTDTWEEVARLPAYRGLDASPWLGVAFHPSEPVLATVGLDGNSVQLWHIDLALLLGRAPRKDTVRYTNAKVVLVGDSSVGKSGLSWVLQGEPWRETASTHGRFVWTLSREESKGPLGERFLREIYLWDLAGQPGYRLVHQLHLGDAAVALVVFDAQSETDPLGGARHWSRALDQARQRVGERALPLTKLLVQGRADRGGVSMSPGRLEQVRNELGCTSLHRTSAKEGWGIEDLRAALLRAIRWDQLPTVSSNELFVGIQQFVRATKESGQVLLPAETLFSSYLGSQAHGASGLKAEAARSAFDTCIGLIEGQGLVIRLHFGGLILLQPELLDAYASAMVNAARDEPGGLGALPEDLARAGGFEMAGDFRVRDVNQEGLLLIATVEHLLRNELALRETADDGVHLVFRLSSRARNPNYPSPSIQPDASSFSDQPTTFTPL